MEREGNGAEERKDVEQPSSDAAEGTAAQASASQTPDSDSALDFHVVGIGASAGGFEALESFFSEMPPDNGMAFVVVQHLSPDHKSLMVELLSKHTPMKVVQAEDNMGLEPNRIYLIPPRKLISLAGGRLRLEDKGSHKQTLSFPIDIFLHSLAEEQGERAVAIILSGTGSDGTRGIRAVKEHGGLIMVQDPASSKFDGMPRNAMATGLADYVATPGRMPQELMQYLRHPLAARSRRQPQRVVRDEDKLAKVFSLLKEKTGVDFTHYKQSTVVRRIERRMSINQLDNLEDYIAYLYRTPSEAHILHKELLIGVTRFFRDTEAYEYLEREVIPAIFEQRLADQPIRVWVAGCSTGEEAYSLAILFREYMDKAGVAQEIKIFATDVDAQALESASLGQYPENIAADLSAERFKRYFIRKGDKYQIVKGIREMVIFALHNIIKDPPFNKIDLLTCRNLLIYLQPVLQKKVLLNFNFALNEGAYMFLGSSETIGEYGSLFETVHNKWKFFRCKGKAAPIHVDNLDAQPLGRRRRPYLPMDVEADPEPSATRRTTRSVYDSLFEEYVPPTAIINAKRNVQHILGDVSRYLKLQQGAISLGITDLLRKDLSVAVETALNKAQRQRETVVYRNVPIRDGEGDDRVDIKAIPAREGGQDQLLALVFEPSSGPPSEAVAERGEVDYEDGAEQRIHDLEHELQYTKENLQATIEELETTNEELQATNEELLSANEELQSTNEELQSVNEELITVNSEYQGKIQELTELNNDINNLLTSTRIGTVFLDKDLRVRKFTPAMSELASLMDVDIGRPVNHITFNVKYDGIQRDCRKVLDKREGLERELETNDGSWLLMRVLPYRTEDDEVLGVVVTFVDITRLKETSEELRKLSRAVELSPSVVVITDANGVIEYVNQSFTEITGYTAEEVVGQTPSLLRGGGTDGEEYRDLWRTIGSGRKWSGVFYNKKKSGECYYEMASIVPIQDDDGETRHYLKVAEDITELKRSEELLEASRQRVLNILESTTDCYLELDEQWRSVFVNRKAVDLFDRSRKELAGEVFWDVFPELRDSELRQRLEQARGQGETTVFETRFEPTGAWLECHVFPSDGGVYVYFRDVTKRRRYEATLRQSEERFRSTFEQAAVGMAHMDLDGHWVRVNDTLCSLLGRKRKQLLERDYREFIRSDHHKELHDALTTLRTGEKESCHVEVGCAGSGDGEVWLGLTISLLGDEEGTPWQYLVVAEDVTRRRQSEENLRNEHQLMLSIAETSPVAITLVDNAGKVVYANITAERLFALDRGDITRRAFNDPHWRITGLDGEPFPEERLPFNRVMQGGEPVQGVVHALEDEKGNRKVLSINASPLFDGSGEIRGVVNAISDISHLSREEQERMAQH